MCWRKYQKETKSSLLSLAERDVGNNVDPHRVTGLIFNSISIPTPVYLPPYLPMPSPIRQVIVMAYDDIPRVICITIQTLLFLDNYQAVFVTKMLRYQDGSEYHRYSHGFNHSLPTHPLLLIKKRLLDCRDPLYIVYMQPAKRSIHSLLPYTDQHPARALSTIDGRSSSSFSRCPVTTSNLGPFSVNRKSQLAIVRLATPLCSTNSETLDQPPTRPIISSAFVGSPKTHEYTRKTPDSHYQP